MPDKSQVTHKRQKIQESSRTMFMWVAGMAAVVGFCGVVAWFIFQQAAFKIKVVDAKNVTVKTLKDNNAAIPDLKDGIRVFETNAALNSAKADGEQNALQVILDALPADANALALGGSLQERLVKGVPNLTLETLTVQPTSTSLTRGERNNRSKKTTVNKISFRLTVSSPDANAIKTMLDRFERSIRVIDVDSLTLERSERLYTMTIDAHAYYEPNKVIELQEKVETP